MSFPPESIRFFSPINQENVMELNPQFKSRQDVRSVIAAIAIGVSMLVMSLTAAAQTAHGAAGHGNMKSSTSGDASMKMHSVMQEANKKMESMTMSNDVDHDFVMMMRDHHQTGIDMAQIEVANGKDPTAIKAAKKIIEMQKKEIAQFDAWLKKHPMK
jgi:uncharacterized protein (DUF305 family)